MRRINPGKITEISVPQLLRNLIFLKVGIAYQIVRVFHLDIGQVSIKAAAGFLFKQLSQIIRVHVDCIRNVLQGDVLAVMFLDVGGGICNGGAEGGQALLGIEPGEEVHDSVL